MKIMHPVLEHPIKFDEDMISILQIEHQEVFRNIIEEIRVQICEGTEGEFILSDELKQYSWKSDVELLIDFFSLNMNNKKILNRLYKELEQEAVGSEYYIQTQEVIAKINQYIIGLTEKFDIALDYEEKINIQDLFKIGKITICESDTKFLEKIIDYIKVTQEFLNIQLYIFVGIKGYLTKEELEQIYGYFIYNKINVLLVENRESEIQLDIEKYYILDNDGCEIY